MFAFKSIFVLLAAATTFTSAMPASPANGASLAERAAPMGVDVFARAPEPVALAVRGGPTTVPDCISKCQDTVAPILVNIQAAIDAKASVTVFVTLYAQIVVAIQALTVDILALVGASVDILAGLTLEAVAVLFVNLFLSICVKLQATVAIFGVVDITAFLSVYLQICAAIIACVKAIVQVCVGINVFLDVQLSACIAILVQLCLTLGASATVIANLKALLVL
jgi:hypothetical protein